MLIQRKREQKPIEPWKGPKPPLPMVVTRVCRVHYRDLQDYLAKVYRMRDYDILKTLGLTNGICPEFLVDGTLPPAGNIQQQIDGIRQGRRTRNLSLILAVLYLDGFIPEGKYIIDTAAVANPLIKYRELLSLHEDPNHQVCVAYRKQHRDREFQRRAAMLDKFAQQTLQERSHDK